MLHNLHSNPKKWLIGVLAAKTLTGKMKSMIVPAVDPFPEINKTRWKRSNAFWFG
jgi:hypothetical protein